MDADKIIHISEIANLYAAILEAFPKSLDTNHWDLLRIAISSWVLTVSKSTDNLETSKVST